MHPLHVLSVAYPFAAAGPDAVGGAEQVLSSLDAGLIVRGHRSTVIACEGSVAAGRLVMVPAPAGEITDAVRERTWAAVRAAIAEVCRRDRPDVVHLHGLDFAAYLPPAGVPAVATLHLPPGWYPPATFRLDRPDMRLVCVSPSQRRACPPSRMPIEVIENGVDVARLAARHAPRRFALMIGRVCPEKGQHAAIEAARRAGVPLLIGGAVFPYPEHRAYFEDAVAPHLGPGCRFLGPVGVARKRRLMSAAACLLVPSTAPETSSLVTMEAFACGTPVIAFRAGALPDLIEDGRTGFLVADVAEMAARIGAVSRLDRDLCRRVARERFDRECMITRYCELYRELARAGAKPTVRAQA